MPGLIEINERNPNMYHTCTPKNFFHVRFCTLIALNRKGWSRWALWSECETRTTELWNAACNEEGLHVFFSAAVASKRVFCCDALAALTHFPPEKPPSFGSVATCKRISRQMCVVWLARILYSFSLPKIINAKFCINLITIKYHLSSRINWCISKLEWWL